jgi:hypothetical protein
VFAQWLIAAGHDFRAGPFAVARTLGYAGESAFIGRSSGLLDQLKTKKEQ